MDYGHQKSEEMLQELERRLQREYRLAYKDVKKKADAYFAKFRAEDAEMLEKMRAGDITLSDYTTWRQKQMLTGRRWTALCNQLAQDMTQTNVIAMQIINEDMLNVYALNYNYGAYEIESGLGIDTSFAMYDHNVVARMVADDPNGLFPQARVDIPKDMLWNRQKIASAITQGVMQGESIPKIAQRLKSVTGMNQTNAIRNARTYCTGAENGGRYDSYKRAEKMGIEIEKIWQATLDSRTRTSHRHLDGQRIPYDEEFSNGLKYPGDPDGPGAEIYNCRCTMYAAPMGFKYQDVRDYSRIPGGMTYDEWLDAKPVYKRRA